MNARDVAGKSKIKFFQPGQKLQYKEKNKPKGVTPKEFVVQNHTYQGIRFLGRDGLFSPEYFELA